MSEVRKAEYFDPKLQEDAAPIKVSEFGQLLRRHTEELIQDPTRISPRLRSQLMAEIHELKEESSCDVVDLEDHVIALRTAINIHITPEEKLRSYTAYVIIVITLCAALLFSPWDILGRQIGQSDHRNFVPALAMFLICNSSLCAIIANLSTNWLNEETLANSKTLAKATTLVLALSTLILGADLTVTRQVNFTAAGIVLFISILLSTLSADNLVGQSEARLSVLLRSR
ncbi:hypothetical protein [Actinopolymorpha pittospori]|uniref:Uncharacterized protein n=1 Tax=Actinopolymorpha pittospori TaxID=648752 RepID=A0A927MRJ7_9ACTN|nr:hypothetical protein [Actinopolymorpha pittospori]MBE1605571.1 hypothetical protein [Actinopolymorpha pittospori]